MPTRSCVATPSFNASSLSEPAYRTRGLHPKRKAGLGRVLIGCYAKTLTLSVSNRLNTRRGIGLHRINDANLHYIPKRQAAV